MVVARGYELQLLDAAGAARWTVPVSDQSSASGAAVWDVDLDGVPEVFYRDELSFVIVEGATKRAVEPLNYFNIGPEDEGVTVRSIAEAVLRVAAPETPIRYTGGSRGWVGDVPKFRYSIEKLGKLGWRPTLRSKQAVERAVAEIYDKLRDKVRTSCSS